MPDEPESNQLASDDGKQRRLEALERRVEALEQQLSAGVASKFSADTDDAARAVEHTDESAIERAAEAKRRQRARELFARREGERQHQLDKPEQIPARRVRPSKQDARKKPAERREAINIERMIGGRWYAVIGALIVVTGVALAFKLAWDLGWFGRMPDWGKCLGGLGFGAALLGAGEVLRKKIGGWGCAGLNSAGIGVLYATAYAAFARFELMSLGIAMVLLAAVTLVGVFVAARSRLVSVSAVALIGGYATPVLVSLNHVPAAWALPAYWVMLLVTGLALSAALLGKFHRLRSLAWWATGLVATPWMIAEGVDHLAVAMVFAGVCWAAVHAELVISALREKNDPGYVGDRAWWSGRVFIASFSTTTWCAAMGAYVVSQAAAGQEWLATGVGVLLAIGVAGVTAGRLRVLRDRPGSAIERLGASLAMQAGALVIATIALGVSVAWVQMVCWLALGVASVGAGRWLRARGLDVYGLLVLGIATVRVLVLDWGAYQDDSVWWSADVWGLHLTPWSVLCASTAAAWFSAGALEKLFGGVKWGSVATDIAIGLGFGMLCVAPLQAGTTHGSYFAYLPAVALLTGIFGVVVRSEWLAVQGIVTLFVSILGAIAASWWTDAGEVVRGLVVSDWGKRLVWFAAAWTVYGWIAGAYRAEWVRDAKRVVWLIAVGVLLAAFVNKGADRASVHAAWLAICAVLTARCFVIDRRRADILAVPALVAGAVAWVIAYIEPGWSSIGGDAGTHAGLWSGLGMVVLGLVCARMLTNGGREMVDDTEQSLAYGLRIVALVLALAVSFAATSFEVARSADLLASDEAARLGAVSIWWALFAGGLLVLGFVKRAPAVRYVGLALLGIAAVKAVLFDLRSVEQVWRVASFLSVGLLMLSVGVVYARVDQVLKGAAQEDNEGDEDEEEI